MLHSSSDSRAIALKKYCLSFAGVSGRPKYFDFTRDILHFIECPTRFTECPSWRVKDKSEIRKDLKLVQNLTICDRRIYKMKVANRILGPYESLQKLIVQRNDWLDSTNRRERDRTRGREERIIFLIRNWYVDEERRRGGGWVVMQALR
jgi:hypothetical protein